MAGSGQRFKLLLLVIFLQIWSFHTVTPNRIKEKIYIDISAKHGCFRLLNGTHQIGCSSSQDGNTGVVHFMQTQEDYDYVMEKGTTGPYVPVINFTDFTITNVRRLVRSGRVTGIAVLNVNISHARLSPFSADHSCPNDAYGLYHGTDLGGCSKVRWNPAGDGLFFDDLNIPIFSIIKDTDTDNILTKCWEGFNKPKSDGRARSFPLCAMELLAAMSGAKDSETCMRRSGLWVNLNPFSFCDPLGDKNVVATLKAVASNTTRPPRSLIVAATRMDSMGMFYNQFSSSDTTVTGIVTLLAAARALWRLRADITALPSSKDIMFAFLNGEAFDYIGSSRMIFDMQKGKFPEDVNNNVNMQKINLTHIAQFVELSQVGMKQDGNSLWLHVDPTVRKQTNVKNFLDRVSEIGQSTNITFQSPDPRNPLPPASLQRFLKEASAPFPSFVITDHDTSFTNKYYNSHRDLPEQIGGDYPAGLNESQKYEADTVLSRRLTTLATTLATYLFWTATDSKPTVAQQTRLQADIKDVNHMLYCFLHNPRCDLFNFVISVDDAENLNKNFLPFPFYVTIHEVTNQITDLTRGILAYFTGEVVPKVNQDRCDASGHDKRYTYLWMQGGKSSPGGERTPVCYRSTAIQTDAKSPAFDLNDYDWRSGRYSTWTESRWYNFRVRVFLKPSKQLETLVLCVGVVLLLVSLLLVYWVHSKAHILFSTRGPPRRPRRHDPTTPLLDRPGLFDL